MKFLITISCIFLFTSLKKETTEITDTDIYQIINYISKTRYNPTKTNYITEDLSTLNEKEIKSVNLTFSKKDVEYIYEQDKKRPKFKLNQKLLSNGVIIHFNTLKQMKDDTKQTTSFWERFKTKYHGERLLSISLPVFSKDKNVALVTTSIICSTCINRETSVYKKVNGKWKLDKQLYSSQT